MDDKTSEAEVSSSSVLCGGGEKEQQSKAESTTKETGNGTSKLECVVDEPPTKSPKTNIETEPDEQSVEMAQVSSTNSSPPAPDNKGEVEVSESQSRPSLDKEGNPFLTNNLEVDKESPTSDGEEPMSISEPEPEVQVELRVIYNKKPIPVKISLKKTVGDLKKVIEKSTNVTPELMKVLVKGAKDEVTLESLGLNNGSKVLVIGTPLDEVLAVSKVPTAKELSGEESNGSSSNEVQNWCSIPRHSKVIDKGLPDDVMAGIRDEHEPLPPFPLFGMLSSKGAKVRLTFKLESDELWIGTKERTEKVPISTIRSVVSQPITGFEHYSIVAIQLGSTEASRFYVYWVPSQYVNAIKRNLGS